MPDVVQFSRAIADSTRWRIAKLVLREALCVCELADILEMRQSTVSSHVQILRKADLFESEKCEKWTYFRIRSEYRPLILALDQFFAEQANEAWSHDAPRAAARLLQREQSCCPGPRKLISTTRDTTLTLKIR
ncbi:winged helix-turn-helix transcriptional regulator [Luteolibacter pohnpeiensis]|uniref:Winged helix-turn-helix transcriptional regulator n=1 Tax=Luteolibacter pohnpeiensis TaxID=454153 RepID=A0A934S5L8_9BACT|nr:metalloregulator ArsR/SmtB family transcription factor [Luteolibacter pohnpeiensis]MBK1882298.1 winged helix-turn-helix transcriptional regulator [Luteolibacter pohnpeiensis]